MPYILEGTTDPGVTPGGVLLRHPHHQPADLLEHAGTLRPLRVRPLPRDKLPMPPQNCVGGDDRGDVAQCSASQSVPTHGQPTPFVIGQPQSPNQLSSEDSILFDQVGHALLLPAVQPAGQNSEKQPRGREIDHGGSLYHRLIFEPQVVRPRGGTLSLPLSGLGRDIPRASCRFAMFPRRIVSAFARRPDLPRNLP